MITKLYWSRAPGRFVNKYTGEEPKFAPEKKEMIQVSEVAVATVPRTVVRVFQEQVTAPSVGLQFHGTVREWYETLIEVITDAANTIWKRNLQPPGVIEVSPEVLTMLEHTIGYSPKSSEEEKTEQLPMTRGKWVGNLNNRWKLVCVDSMANNEAVILLITDTAYSLPTEPAQVLNRPISSELKELLQIPSFDSSIKSEKLTEPSKQNLPSLQRLDQITVHVLDMCIL